MSLGPYLNTGATMSDRDLFGLIIGGKPDDSKTAGTYALAHHESRDTELAVAVSQTGDSRAIFFIPRKCLGERGIRNTGKATQTHIGAQRFPVIEVEIPGWLAKQKGLI